MYEKIKEELNQKYYLETYPNDGQRFVAWYLRNVHGLDIYQTKDCITDGANDKQIDAVFIDDDESKIYIIQGKFYNSSTVDAEPLNEVLKAWMEIQNLEKLQECANEKLRSKISEIAKALEDDYEVFFELITTSVLTDAAQHDLDMMNDSLAENDKISASIVVIDKKGLPVKLDEALNKERPYVNHEFNLEKGKYMEMVIDNIKTVIAAIPLKECINIPGIKDGTLFRKNVRQSLGLSNKINKGIANTIKHGANNFFYYHNGITAVCSYLNLTKEDILQVKELNVVNGCQSLSTIYNCSEKVKKLDDAYIMFRFYEITEPEIADKISTFTNSQSNVKARDLRSNDKRVKEIKKAYEECFTNGCFITKRGEKSPSLKDKSYVVNLVDLGKWLIAWQSQRPTLSYSETKIFDKYFEQLFKSKEITPYMVQALNELYSAVMERWTEDNPIRLNETLLAMKAYAPYHWMYAISEIICVLNNKPTSEIPDVVSVLKKLKNNNLLDNIVDLAGNCLNRAFENALSEANENGKVFNPQNWIKNKSSLKDIRAAIKSLIDAIKSLDKAKHELWVKSLNMKNEEFAERWTAD